MNEYEEMQNMGHEIYKLRAALAEKEKWWAKWHDEIVEALDKEKSAAEREAQGLREQLEGFVNGTIWRSAESCDKLLAAQAQEIKTLRERVKELKK